VINEYWLLVPWAGLARIGSYVSAMPADFRGLGEVEASPTFIHSPWQPRREMAFAVDTESAAPDQISNSIPISMICELGILK
jgi:hypothetical protein